MSHFAAALGTHSSPHCERWLSQATRMLQRFGEVSQTRLPGLGICNATAANTQSPELIAGRYSVHGLVRLDQRAALCERLQDRYSWLDRSHCDAQLLLAAWLQWGHALSSHVSGDFAVLIWDNQTQTAIALRDQIGGVPLYYARTREALLVSDTAQTLLLHPQISRRPDMESAADFLVFSFNSDLSRSSFADIAQLPPGHWLDIQAQRVQTHRYWQLSDELSDDSDRTRPKGDCVEGFRHHVQQAIRDRVRGDSAGIAFSGGLDSSALAAMTGQQSAIALYMLYGHGILDERKELDLAHFAADHIGANLISQAVNENDLFRAPEGSNWTPAEPSRDVFPAPFLSLITALSQSHDLGLTGLGADSILRSSPHYLPDLLRDGHWFQAAIEGLSSFRATGQRPPLQIRNSLRRRYEKSPLQLQLTPWLHSDLIRNTGIKDRFAAMSAAAMPPASNQHPRKEAIADISSALWPSIMQRYASQSTGLALRFFHPYLDLSLIRYTLSLPPLPWFQRKWLLREAAQGLLPDEVRLRPKSTPHIPALRSALLSRSQQHGITSDTLARLDGFIEPSKLIDLSAQVRALRPEESDLIVLPLCFNRWLQQLQGE